MQEFLTPGAFCKEVGLKYSSLYSHIDKGHIVPRAMLIVAKTGKNTKRDQYLLSPEQIEPFKQLRANGYPSGKSV